VSAAGERDGERGGAKRNLGGGEKEGSGDKDAENKQKGIPVSCEGKGGRKRSLLTKQKNQPSQESGEGSKKKTTQRGRRGGGAGRRRLEEKKPHSFLIQWV